MHVRYPAWVATAMDVWGREGGERLPLRLVRREDGQVSELVLARMGSPRIDIDAAVLPLMAPIARIAATVSYRKAIGHRGPYRSTGLRPSSEIPRQSMFFPWP